MDPAEEDERHDGCSVNANESNRIIIVIGILALFAALILPRMRPTADAANRIRADFHEAEKPVLKPGSDLPEVEQFARDLRAIDLTGAPDDVEQAMNALIVAVEANASDRRLAERINVRCVVKCAQTKQL